MSSPAPQRNFAIRPVSIAKIAKPAGRKTMTSDAAPRRSPAPAKCVANSAWRIMADDPSSIRSNRGVRAPMSISRGARVIYCLSNRISGVSPYSACARSQVRALRAESEISTRSMRCAFWRERRRRAPPLPPAGAAPLAVAVFANGTGFGWRRGIGGAWRQINTDLTRQQRPRGFMLVVGGVGTIFENIAGWQSRPLADFLQRIEAHAFHFADLSKKRFCSACRSGGEIAGRILRRRALRRD